MAELLRGIPAAPGLAIGNAVVWRDLQPIPLRRPVSSPPEELARLESALQETSRQLRSIMDRVASGIGQKEAQILKTQLLMLGDPMLVGQVKDSIRSGGLSAEQAVDQAVRSMAEKFLALAGSGERAGNCDRGGRPDRAAKRPTGAGCLERPPRHDRGWLPGRDGGQHWRPLGSRRGPGGWSRKRRRAADRVPVPEPRDAALRARAIRSLSGSPVPDGAPPGGCPQSGYWRRQGRDQQRTRGGASVGRHGRDPARPACSSRPPASSALPSGWRRANRKWMVRACWA